MKRIRMGILGAGNIANSMAEAMKGLSDRVIPYGVASRSLDKAETFAARWGFEKAYGSYEELAEDPEIDLIYVATPHSHHFAHATLCVEHGKPVLVEKAFTGNMRQAEQLIRLAREKKILVAEAIWTRYMPAGNIVRSLLESGAIGEPKTLKAEFSVPLTHVQRLWDPALAGGALLDLGIYALTFASMYFGDDIVSVESVCEKYETGVDAADEIQYTYRDGKKAYLRTSFIDGPVNEGTIYGTKGYLHIPVLNNYTAIRRYDNAGNLMEEYPIPKQINGYEYELLACLDALQKGQLECMDMPHFETLEMMRQMDALRREWGVVYPFDKYINE